MFNKFISTNEMKVENNFYVLSEFTVEMLKGHSTDFTHRREKYSKKKLKLHEVLCGCGGSFLKSAKTYCKDVIRVILAWAWKLQIYNRKTGLQTLTLWFTLGYKPEVVALWECFQVVPRLQR